MISNKVKLLLLGPLSPPVSGPGVKNSMLLDWLAIQPEFDVKVFNTNAFRCRDFKSIINGLFFLILSKRVVLSASINGRFLFIPLCILLGKRVYLFPAGGSFDEEISSLASWRRRLFLFFCRRVRASFVQTTSLKEGMESLGLGNVFLLQNPRVNREKRCVIRDVDDELKVVFLSKIRAQKGVLYLIDAVRKVREKWPSKDLKVSFFGIVDENFRENFYNALVENRFCSYEGVCEPDVVQETVSQFDLFVLPTLLPEGVPGAVVEAMFTGIPIVVSNFTAAKEMMGDDINGVVVPQGDVDALASSIESLMLDKRRRLELSTNALAASERYSYDTLMTPVKEKILSE